MGEASDRPLISNRPPDLLYRYRSLGTDYFFEEVRRALRGEVYLSPFVNMNDPFEALPINEKSSLRELKIVINRVKKKHGRHALITGRNVDFSKFPDRRDRVQLRKKLGNPLNIARVCDKTIETIVKKNRNKCLACFSEVNDSLLMWSHYTSGHRGYVFEYEFDEDAVLEHRPALVPLKVKYTEERPVLRGVELLEFAARSAIGADEEISDRVLDALSLTKSSDWSYEQEWRVVSTSGGGYSSIEALKLVGIIAGSGVTDEHLSVVREIVGDQIRVRRAILNPKEFSLIVIDT